MQVLVTRPLPDAWDMKARIERLGLGAVLAPLIEILPLDLTLDQFEGAVSYTHLTLPTNREV